MLQDVRYAARVMMKARGLTIVAIVTLGLGIGANTAIFSVINALLLRPLPYPDADRLVMVWQDMRARGGPATEWTTPANHFDWSAQKDVFESVTTFRGWNASLAGNGLPEAVVGEQVTPEYFDVLGGRALLGRTFRQDDGLPNAPRVVVLASQLWTERFGGDRSIIGRVVSINGEPHEIVGVLAPGFRPALATDARIWRPQQLDAQRASRNAVVFHTIGKLKAGVPLEQARAKLATLAARLQQRLPPIEYRRGHQSRAASGTAGGRHASGALHAVWRRGLRPADRVRQHREPPALPRIRPAARNGGPPGARRGSTANHPAAVDREPAAGARGRHTRGRGQCVGRLGAAVDGAGGNAADRRSGRRRRGARVRAGAVTRHGAAVRTGAGLARREGSLHQRPEAGWTRTGRRRQRPGPTGADRRGAGAGADAARRRRTARPDVSRAAARRSGVQPRSRPERIRSAAPHHL